MQTNFLRRKPSVRRQRGLQIVEVALVMPIMLFLLGIVAEYGRYFHMRSTLLRATAAGARYMSDKKFNDSVALAAAKSITVCGKTTTCTDANRIYPDFTEANVTVEANVTQNVPGYTANGTYVVVATTGIIYKPIINLKKLSKYFTSQGQQGLNWGDAPIVVKTRMQYTGS
ncbi:MAG: pilus assembly protein [Acidobacteria bacterium]|nr:pilus assembly protein [Acidobacteriota bacterium]